MALRLMAYGLWMLIWFMVMGLIKWRVWFYPAWSDWTPAAFPWQVLGSAFVRQAWQGGGALGSCCVGVASRFWLLALVYSFPPWSECFLGALVWQAWHFALQVWLYGIAQPSVVPFVWLGLNRCRLLLHGSDSACRLVTLGLLVHGRCGTGDNHFVSRVV